MQDQPDLIKDLVNRVYTGRGAASMLNYGMEADFSLPDPMVAVGEDIWKAITDFSEAELKRDETVYALKYDFSLREEIRPATVMGLPITHDSSLMPKEIRLRWEIAL